MQNWHALKLRSPAHFLTAQAGGWGDSTKTKIQMVFGNILHCVQSFDCIYALCVWVFHTATFESHRFDFLHLLGNSHLPRPLVVYVRLKKVGTWQFLGTRVGGKQNWKRNFYPSTPTTRACEKQMHINFSMDHVQTWDERKTSWTLYLTLKSTLSQTEKNRYYISSKRHACIGTARNIATLTTCSWVKTVSNKNVKLYMRHANCFTTSFNSFTRPGKMSFVKQSFSRFWQKFGFAWRSSLGTSNNLFDHNTSWVFNSSIANDLKLQTNQKRKNRKFHIRKFRKRV